MVCQAFPALIRAIDSPDNPLQTVCLKKVICFLNYSEKGKVANIVFYSLSKNNNLVKEIGNPVRLVGDHQDNAVLISDNPEILHERSGHDSIQAGIWFVQEE